MPEMKTCPVCGTEMDKSLDQCPVCGLKGLNRVFNTREELQAWIRDVREPHRQWYKTHSAKAPAAPRRVSARQNHAKILAAARRVPARQNYTKTPAAPCRVFAGQNYALYLTEGGRLYGFGSNDTNCISPDAGRQIRTPVLMAEDVVSAAAGYNYSIYLSQDGYVQLVGHSPIPYTERFKPFYLDTAKVYADCSRDTFWLLGKDGQLQAFGSNLHEEIAARTDKLEYHFSEISIKVHYTGELVTNSRKYGSQGYQAYASSGGYNSSDGGPQLSSQILQLKNTQPYRYEAWRHGSCEENLDLRFRPLPEKTRVLREGKTTKEERGGYGAMEHTRVENMDKLQEEFFVPELHRVNRHIFVLTPVPESKYHDPNRFLCGSGLVTKDEVPERLRGTDQKLRIADRNMACILTKDHGLDLVARGTHDRKRALNGVMDCSAANGTVYLIREDGRIFQTTMVDLWNGRSWNDFQKIPLP